MKLRPSEKSLWQNIVLTYASLGQQMEAAIRQADEYVEAYRERIKPDSTPKQPTGEETLVSKVQNILPWIDATRGAFITQQALTIAREYNVNLPGNTIRAIKRFKKASGLSLRESKAIIDATKDFLQNIG